jgi:hypothetical protein
MEDDLLTTRVLTAVGDAWSAAIDDLDASGTPVALPSRPEWMRRIGSGSPVLIAADDRQGRCQTALALEIEPTRALPGHVIARAHHLGASLVGKAGDAVFGRLQRFAANNPRLLQVNLEFVLFTPEERSRVESTLGRLGFRRVTAPRNYQDTLVITLTRNEESLLGSFSSITRRELRQLSQRPVALRPIREAKYANRLNDIAHETLARTGGRYVPRDWAQRIALCEQLPAQSRLVGLFRAGRDDPDALLAYAWGCAHGDHAHYDDAGSTRTEDIKVSMMYPLMWDLVQWAKHAGCRWFDMGGALPESATGDDPRAGIDGFKRRFSKEVVTVGSEWVLEPHPSRARLAAGIRAMGSNLPWRRNRPR